MDLSHGCYIISVGALWVSSRTWCIQHTLTLGHRVFVLWASPLRSVTALPLLDGFLSLFRWALVIAELLHRHRCSGALYCACREEATRTWVADLRSNPNYVCWTIGATSRCTARVQRMRTQRGDDPVVAWSCKTYMLLCHAIIGNSILSLMFVSIGKRASAEILGRLRRVLFLACIFTDVQEWRL